jgi:hypothetical protein
MDPYEVLGVPRRCTREEVKEAFRVRSWHAHPDRGGEEAAFIRIRAAYEQILEDLDRAAGPGAIEPARGPRDGRTTNAPDPRRNPDLIGGVEARRNRRPSGSPDPRAARETYVAWLGRVSAEAARRQSVWRSKWVRALGVMIILGVLSVNLWVCWIAWAYDPVKEARRVAWEEAKAKSALQERLRVATRPYRPRAWQPVPAEPRGLMIIPFDSTLYLTPLGGGAVSVTEFGLGTSLANHRPIFTGLPRLPDPGREVKVGRVAAGSKLQVYLKTNESWVFSGSAASREWDETFSDRDGSLGGNGSIVEKTGPTTWVLHLDDVGSGDDDDDDVLIGIRLEPVPPTVPAPEHGA